MKFNFKSIFITLLLILFFPVLPFILLFFAFYKVIEELRIRKKEKNKSWG